MGRQIRINSATAQSLGLLDPEVANLVKGRKNLAKNPKKPKSAKKATSGVSATPATSAKPKRREPRIAVHPFGEGSGHGHIEKLEDGSVYRAEFVFDVIPVPKERPRVVKNPKTGAVFGYTPERTAAMGRSVKAVISRVMGQAKPISGPLRIDMTFVMPLPASWPKWKKEAALEGLIVPTGRPDMDNLEKNLLDAANETLIVDDSYVINRHAWKIYGETPAIKMSVEQTGQHDINTTRAAIEALRKIKKDAQDA
jgi:Holliday junction resolvase RusA-like endonuclease